MVEEYTFFLASLGYQGDKTPGDCQGVSIRPKVPGQSTSSHCHSESSYDCLLNYFQDIQLDLERRKQGDTSYFVPGPQTYVDF